MSEAVHTLDEIQRLVTPVTTEALDELQCNGMPAAISPGSITEKKNSALDDSGSMGFNPFCFLDMLSLIGMTCMYEVTQEGRGMLLSETLTQTGIPV